MSAKTIVICDVCGRQLTSTTGGRVWDDDKILSIHFCRVAHKGGVVERAEREYIDICPRCERIIARRSRLGKWVGEMKQVDESYGMDYK